MSTKTGVVTNALPTHVDVLVVGAGLSGIGVGYHLKQFQPGRTFAIIDSRDAIGGTWDLFRYPGVRSDTGLHTFGYGFKPWTGDNAIADADEILDYLQETIDENDLGRHICLGHKVVKADFSKTDERWTVSLERLNDGTQVEVTARILFSAAGYYDGDQGYAPHFEGQEHFAGQIVHPQAWPEDLDYAGKKVVVVGSGATAVTLLPSLAKTADHVTMLQRSPGYVIPVPRQDPIANTLRRWLPDMTAYRIARSLNTSLQNLVYRSSRRFPKQMRALIRRINAKALPVGYDVDTHFNPAYEPWDQRMCVVPDNDLFRVISQGSASVVTDRVVRFTKTGILLESGTQLEADIVVTATGLNMVPFGKIELNVDGQKVNLPDHVVYKSLMVNDIPNFIFTMGYVHLAWTLKADLVARWFCRLLAHMDEHGYSTAMPVLNDPEMPRKPLIGAVNSGYVSRGVPLFPKVGTRGPWVVTQNYNRDRALMGKGPIEDASLHYTSAKVRPEAQGSAKSSVGA